MSRHGPWGDTANPVKRVSRYHLGDTDSLPWGVEENGGTVLALDIGTATGWAILRDGQISSGSVNFRSSRFEGGGMRFLKFRQWLTETKHQAGGFERIAFEEVRRHAGIDAAHCYGGFLATLTAWAEHHRIPYQGVPVGTWKKALTGKGNASKGDVLAAVKSEGYAPASEDEADAIGIVLWTMETGA